MLLSALFAVCWYLVWWDVKRRRESVLGGPIIPLFYPPKLLGKHEMSAGELRYFLHMQYDFKQFAAEVVAMAVKGMVSIDFTKGFWGGSYTLKKARDVDTQIDSSLHQKISQLLFSTGDKVQLSSSSQNMLQGVGETVKALYANNNAPYFMAQSQLVMMPFFVSLFGLIILYVVVGFDTGFSVAAWWCVVMGIVLGIWGAYLLKTYTQEGCVIKNKILGFKMFLAATETDRMELVGTPPTRTPELYEKYLPYAIALDVERQWSQQFASVFAQLENQGVHYQPLWYHGGSFGTFNPTAFSSHISNSMQSATASSGGGGRGGGSSGGGRGGGGGGSW
jgi:uncharacterized membrane protein